MSSYESEHVLTLLQELSVLKELNSVGPGRWPGQCGKELVLVKPFLHPETERQATEGGR